MEKSCFANETRCLSCSSLIRTEAGMMVKLGVQKIHEHQMMRCYAQLNFVDESVRCTRSKAIFIGCRPKHRYQLYKNKFNLPRNITNQDLTLNQKGKVKFGLLTLISILASQPYQFGSSAVKINNKGQFSTVGRGIVLNIVLSSSRPVDFEAASCRRTCAVTAFWASPRFGHPHSHIPSVLRIPGGGCPKR